MTSEDTRLSRLEVYRENMANDIKDLKEDFKAFKVETTENFRGLQDDIGELKIQIAKWAGAIAVIVIIAQLVISKVIEHL